MVIQVGYRAGLTDRQLTRFFAKVQRGAGCWEWSGYRLPRGYGMFNAGRFADGRTDMRYAHRVMWELHHGPILKGLVVRHACDNPPCCNPAHLRLGTQADNIADAQRQGKYSAERPNAWIAPARIRRHVIREALNGPRGTLARLCREHGLPMRTMAVAVHRARKRQPGATHG